MLASSDARPPENSLLACATCRESTRLNLDLALTRRSPGVSLLIFSHPGWDLGTFRFSAAALSLVRTIPLIRLGASASGGAQIRYGVARRLEDVRSV